MASVSEKGEEFEVTRDSGGPPEGPGDGPSPGWASRLRRRAGLYVRFLIVPALLAAAVFAVWLVLWAFRLARGVFLPGNLQLELHLVEVGLLAFVAADLLVRFVKASRPRFGVRTVDGNVVPVAGRLVVGQEGGAWGLSLPSPQVSRRHLQLEETGEGLRVTDLGSRNGTFVDGEDIRERGAVPVEAGAVLEAGLAGPRLVVEALPVRGLFPSWLRLPLLLALLWTGLFLGWRSNITRLPDAPIDIAGVRIAFAPFRDRAPMLGIGALLTAVLVFRRLAARRLPASSPVSPAMDAVDALLVVGTVVLYPLLPAEGMRYAEAARRTLAKGNETTLGPLAGNLAARAGASPWKVTFFRQAGALALLWGAVALALSFDRIRSFLGGLVPFLSRPLLGARTEAGGSPVRRGLRLLLYRDVLVGFLAAAVVVATVWTPLGTTLGRGKRLFLALPGAGPVQSIELVKALFVLFVAAYFWRHGKLFESAPRTRYLLPFAIACGLTVALTAVQADMGGLLMLGLFVSAMFAVSTGAVRLLAMVPALVGAGVGLALLLGRGDVISARLGIWFSPRTHPFGEQIVNARQLLLSAGATGFEPGRVLAWAIPDIHGDLVVAAIAERYGFVGLLALLALQTVLFLALVALARQARTGALLPAGVAVLLLVQVLTQAGGAVGLIPFTGVPLPWLSHGLTASAIFTVLVGLALAVPAEGRSAAPADPRLDGRLGVLARGAVLSLSGAALLCALWMAFLPLLGTYGPRGREYRWADRARMRSIDHLVAAGAFIADEDGRSWRAAPGATALAEKEGLAIDPRLIADALRPSEGGVAPASYLVTNPNRFADRPLPRGRILARDRTTLAVTGRDGHRVYPLDDVTFHPVGLPGGRAAPFGIEGALASTLDGSDLPSTARVAAFAYDIHRGLDVELTLDPRLQSQAHSALAGRRGAAVLLDLEDGALLALASSPAPLSADRTGARWFDVLEHPTRPLRNRAIASTETYSPPGSTFKIVMAAAALLHRDRFDPTAVETCAGYDPELKVRCAHDAVHGRVDLTRALTVSCNIYFARLAVRLGPEAIREAVGRFGFNPQTPLDLAAGAGEAGLTVAASTAANDLTAIATPPMLARVGFGQGAVSATPLQMARAAAVLATGGRLVDPYLVSAVSLGSDDSADRQVAWRRRVSPPGRTTVLPSSVARQLNDTLRNVFDGQGGTGRNLPKLWSATGAWRLSKTSPGKGWKRVPMAGKTGTAWRTSRGDSEDSWMVAWAPADRPRIVTCVMLEGAGSGGAVAGPIAVDLIRAALEAAREEP